jgi:hypothetical protein
MMGLAGWLVAAERKACLDVDEGRRCIKGIRVDPKIILRPKLKVKNSGVENSRQ